MSPRLASAADLRSMLVRIYLAIYFALIAAAVFALWQAGVLERLPLAWVAAALLVVVGLGLLLGFVSRRPA